MRALPASAACFLLTACSSGLQLEDARALPVPIAGGVGAVYLTVTNADPFDDRLLAAETELCSSVELHESRERDGIARMIPHPEGLVVPAGGKLELRPGGHHLMLYDLRRPLSVGERVPLRLRFERAGTRTLDVPISD